MTELKNWILKELKERVWVSIESTVIGALTLASTLFLDDLSQYLSAREESWAKIALYIVGVVLILIRQNTKVAKAAAKAAAKGAVVAMLLFASTAYASGPGVICLRGCDKVRASGMASGLSDVQLNDVLWAGPGLGVVPFIYNGATHEWSNPVQPAVSFGLWWRPPGWTATKSLVGTALSVTGDFSNLSHIDPLMTVTFFDNFTVGGGVRVNFATTDVSTGLMQRAGVNPLFAVGWQTSLGSP